MRRVGETLAQLGAGALALTAVATFRGQPPTAARNRLVTGALVASFLLATRSWIPDADARAGFQYHFTTTLGYGHLIGAFVFARGRRRPHASAARLLRGAFAAASVLSLFSAYTWALNQTAALVMPLLAVSAWHTVENDLALGRAYRDRLRLDAIPRAVEHHLGAIGAALLLLLLAAHTPPWSDFTAEIFGQTGGWLVLAAMRGACIACGVALLAHAASTRYGGAVLVAGGVAVSPAIAGAVTFADLFVAATLYHLVSWLIFFADRTASLAATAGGDACRALWRRLAAVHLPPTLACTALLLPASGAAVELRFAAFSPAIYLFWSVLHVAQTAWARGLAPRARGA